MKKGLTLFFVPVFSLMFYKTHGQQTCVDPDPGGCGSVNQCAEIELNQEQGANCSTNIEYSARDFIRLKPGFHYKAETGRRFHAKIDNSIIVPVDYATEAPTAIERPLDYTLPAGSIPGNADVTSTGAAVYQIPIHIPPGTNGMQPNVSLVYNSQGKNGMAGYGWNIAGLSVISRLQQDIFHNGAVDAVSLDGNDRFALDGNLLIATSGTYGASNTVYHTELETFNQVTSKGTAGTGPQWFEVKTKQGLIMEFGNSADSRFMDENGTNVLFWRINKISDLNGNYIEYKYNNGNRESRIEEIKYTGNTNLQPYNSIKFYYSERVDKNEHWIAGHSVKSNLILRTIKINVEGNNVKEYELKHFKNNNYSYLGEVNEYSGAGRSHFNSTVFQYGDNTSVFQTAESFLWTGQRQLFTGDYNGDGFSDILTSFFSNEQFYRFNVDYSLHLNPGLGVFSETANTTGNMPPGDFFGFPYSEIIDPRSDFNGNGKDEFAIARFNLLAIDGAVYAKRLQEIEFFEYGTSSFSSYKLIDFSSETYKRVPAGFNYFYPGDFDGDGILDFLTVLFDFPFEVPFNPDFPSSTAQASIYFSSISPAKTITTIDASLLKSAEKILVMDFDGDGKHDLMLVDDNSSTVFSFSQNGTAASIFTGSYPNSYDNEFIYPGDFNGDRKTDLLTLSNAELAWKVSYSTGTVFQSNPFPFSGGFDPETNIIKTGDYNGDGKSDILHASPPTPSSTLVNIYYSNGKDFSITNSPYGKALNLGSSYDPFSNPPLTSGDFNADGKLDEININQVSSQSQKIDILSFNPNARDFLLQSVADGMNYTTSFDYKSRSASSNFLHNELVHHGPLYVVNKMTLPDGIGGEGDIEYVYSNAFVHRQGKGFIGFEKVDIMNHLTDTTIRQQYQLNVAFYHLQPLQTDVEMTSSGKKLFRTAYTSLYHDFGSKRFFPSIQQAVTTKFFPPNSSQAQTETVTETFTYDTQGNGNLQQHISSYKNISGATEATIKKEYQYSAFGTWWIPSRLNKSTVTMSRPTEADDPDDYVREVEYPSYNSSGQLLRIITDPAKQKKVITDFDYSSPFANPTSSTMVADAIQRTRNIEFDAKGRFVTESANALGQSSFAEYEPVYGNVVKRTAIDGLVTTYSYDAFGRLTSTTAPDGNTALITRDWIQDFSPFSQMQSPVYFIQSDIPGMPGVKTIYNIFGQEVRTETEGLNGKIIADKEYDHLNRLSKVFLPYYENALSRPFTAFEYNAGYGYLQKEILSGALCSSCSTTYSINLKTATATNPAGQVSARTSNSLGEIITAADNGGSISYTYYNSGLPESISANGSVISMKYDDFGRQTELTDPNAGTLFYEYNSLGQLFKQTDARGNLYTFDYDLLGRIVSSTNSTEGATIWQYVNSGNGLNKIKRIAGPFSRTDFTYDNLGRTAKISERISGSTYNTEYTYDQFSRISQITYPNAYSSSALPFKIENVYTDDYLTLIKNANTNASIWELTEMNALGQATQYKHGSNIICEKTFNDIGLLETIEAPGIQDLEYDWNLVTGNLVYRKDYNTSPILTETFTYDNLNRLLTSEVTGQTPVEINYYPNGNIQNKTRIGNYVYDNGKLNTVEQVGNPAGDISLMTQAVEYTPFNKVSKITEGDYLLQIGYGPDQERRQSILTNLATEDEERNIIYSGNYEKIKAEDDNTYEVFYLGTGAINVRKNGDVTSDQMFYAFSDHLSSINTITNAAGTKIFEQNFDAWGRKRDPHDWDYDFSNYTPPTLPAATHDPNKWLIRGFTGHEHLDKFALINMNGRVYDPLLGRMLSPDNFVQAPDFTQSYNRYSYAWNNPLIFTDPSGNELGYNWEGREEYYSDYSAESPIIDLFRGIYTVLVYMFGGDIGRDGEVKFPNRYEEEKTYYRSEPGYSEYISQEDIDDLWYDLGNSDYERDIQNLNNFDLINPQFLNLPEGGAQFVDWATNLRQPGASQQITFRIDAAGNPAPNANVRRTTPAGVQQYHPTFASGVVTLNNSTAMRDKGRVAEGAFANFFAGRAINPNVVYFRWPKLGAYPSGNPEGWQYGMILVPNP